MISKIAVVTCYFGKFPWYFSYFLHSCKFNPTVDFIIITDSDEKFDNASDNVIFRKSSLDELVRAASKKLGFKVSISYPYKLCDMKPTYGFLFSDLLKKYDFWGHGDIDIIYGDLRHFLPYRLLNKYDLISFRPEYLAGCFTLYKNSKKLNSLFMESGDYRAVLSRSTYFNFEECNFLFGPLQAGAPIGEVPCKIESMTHVARRKHGEGYLNAYFDFHLIEGATGKISWRNGKIIYKNTFEAALYHFLKFKGKCKNQKMLARNGEPFRISENTIYKKV